MKRISFYLFATLLALGCFFTSCDNDEIVELSQEVAENESSAEQNEDDMYTVQFVNADGTPYEFSGETKGNWTGSKKSYPYWTTVVADWADFKSDATDQVEFSGGDDNTKTLSSGSYTIANNIAQDYTVSVTKKHKVTVSAGTGGSVTNSGTAYRNNGSSLTLTATPSSGYEFSKFVTNTGWEVTDNPKTFTVSSCFTVTAQFKAKAVETQTYTITIKTKSTGIEAGKGAKVSLSVSGHNEMRPNTSQVVSSSTSVKTWTIIANKGATVKVTVSCTNYPCGFGATGEQTKTFSNLSSNQSAEIWINY